MLFLCLLAHGGAAGAPALDLPLACTPGEDCWLVRHVDHDPGPGIRDYACGDLAGDGHQGTDIAIRDLLAMAVGVRVRAAAPGIVMGVRDGVADRNVTEGGPPAVEGQECGNGVRLDHGQGWTTQYCHLRRGSLRVRRGDRVEAGHVLGLVGLSGETSFPHLHFQVGHGGRPIDPFTGNGEADCRAGAGTLWRPEVLDRLAYNRVLLVAAGFATTAPAPRDVRAGWLRQDRLPATSPALVVWVDGYWFERGDQLSFRLTGPDGRSLLAHTRTLEKDHRRFFAYAGLERRGDLWPRGRYRAVVVLERTGAEAPVRARLERDLLIE